LTITCQPNPSALATITNAQQHIKRIPIYHAADAFDSHPATNRNIPLATISHASGGVFFSAANPDFPQRRRAAEEQ
jgi:hypothetical protein